MEGIPLLPVSMKGISLDFPDFTGAIGEDIPQRVELTAQGRRAAGLRKASMGLELAEDLLDLLGESGHFLLGTGIYLYNGSYGVCLSALFEISENFLVIGLVIAKGTDESRTLKGWVFAFKDVKPWRDHLGSQVLELSHGLKVPHPVLVYVNGVAVLLA